MNWYRVLEYIPVSPGGAKPEDALAFFEKEVERIHSLPTGPYRPCYHPKDHDDGW